MHRRQHATSANPRQVGVPLRGLLCRTFLVTAKVRVEPDWRILVLSDVARGLAYLHSVVQTFLLDVKSASIQQIIKTNLKK